MKRYVQAMIAETIKSSARKCRPAPLKVWTAAIIASRALIRTSSPRRLNPVWGSRSARSSETCPDPPRSRLHRPVLRALADLADNPVIDRPRRPRESRQVCPDRLAAPLEHRLDERDFPLLQRITSAPPRHRLSAPAVLSVRSISPLTLLLRCCLLTLSP